MTKRKLLVPLLIVVLLSLTMAVAAIVLPRTDLAAEIRSTLHGLP